MERSDAPLQGQRARIPAAQAIPDRLCALPQDQHQIQVAAHAGITAAIGAEHPNSEKSRVGVFLLCSPAACLLKHLSGAGPTQHGPRW